VHLVDFTTEIYYDARSYKCQNNVSLVPAVLIYFYIYKYQKNIWKGESGKVDFGPCTWFGCSDCVGTDEIDFVHI